jgi:hypothetical protein
MAPTSSEIDFGVIEELVGANCPLEVIDVESQRSFPMKMGELKAYFDTATSLRRNIYNVISLEISKTKLMEYVDAPGVLKKISWITNGVWPTLTTSTKTMPPKKSKIVRSFEPEIPQVYRYCLISAANSYTDFHIDFGGSSVWYHVVKGRKIFFFIEPTDQNLLIYEKWNESITNTEVFLGDKVDKCYKLEIFEGNTIFLPTGWIHSVYTPEDSIVFGGNFLQSISIPLQIK